MAHRPSCARQRSQFPCPGDRPLGSHITGDIFIAGRVIVLHGSKPELFRKLGAAGAMLLCDGMGNARILILRMERSDEARSTEREEKEAENARSNESIHSP